MSTLLLDTSLEVTFDTSNPFQQKKRELLIDILKDLKPEEPEEYEEPLSLMEMNHYYKPQDLMMENNTFDSNHYLLGTRCACTFFGSHVKEKALIQVDDIDLTKESSKLDLCDISKTSI